MKSFPSSVLLTALALVMPTARSQDVPADKLMTVFPNAGTFSPSKKTIADDKRATIEGMLGRKLADTELQQQFYIAKKTEGGVLGLVYVTKVGDTELGIGVAYEGGRIATVNLFAPANSPLDNATFLKQFKDKTVSNTKPVAADQKPLVDFLRAQFDNMTAMDTPQQTSLRKVKAGKDPLADEPAAVTKGIAEYEKLLAAPNASAALGENLQKYREMTKESIAAATAFADTTKANPSDFPKLDAAYKVMNDACEKCHSNNQSPTAKQRRELVPPRGASDFKIGGDFTAPAGQETAAQAVADEVKKAVALIKVLYSLK